MGMRCEEAAIFQRATLVLGEEGMASLGAKKVIVFGVGGVGSWCAEALIRTGIRQLTIVDYDIVDVSNVNRQLMATMETVGEVKVEALKRRLLSINPAAEITALHQQFTAETAADFNLSDYDYIIDAIDSLKDKALLILEACRTEARLFSSMGAARKTDATKIRVSEFWNVQGDPLARLLRKRFKHDGVFPERKFLCVFSDETPEGDGSKGSLVHITAIFGFMLAGLVIQDVIK